MPPSKRWHRKAKLVVLVAVLFLVAFAFAPPQIEPSFAATMTTVSNQGSQCIHYGNGTIYCAALLGITASVVTHSDGTATLSVIVTNVSPDTLYIIDVNFAGTDAPFNCSIYFPCALAPAKSLNWTNIFYNNVITTGQGYPLNVEYAVTASDAASSNFRIATLTVDATSNSGLGSIPTFPYQPTMAAGMAILVVASYLVVRGVPRFKGQVLDSWLTI